MQPVDADWLAYLLAKADVYKSEGWQVEFADVERVLLDWDEGKSLLTHKEDFDDGRKLTISLEVISPEVQS